MVTCIFNSACYWLVIIVTRDVCVSYGEGLESKRTWDFWVGTFLSGLFRVKKELVNLSYSCRISGCHDTDQVRLNEVDFSCFDFVHVVISRVCLRFGFKNVASRPFLAEFGHWHPPWWILSLGLRRQLGPCSWSWLVCCWLVVQRIANIILVHMASYVTYAVFVLCSRDDLSMSYQRGS